MGTQVFVKYGWRPAAALALGWMGLQLVLLLMRGPHCSRYTWLGYEGGLEARKSVVEGKQRGEAQLDLEKPTTRQIESMPQTVVDGDHNGNRKT